MRRLPSTFLSQLKQTYFYTLSTRNFIPFRLLHAGVSARASGSRDGACTREHKPRCRWIARTDVRTDVGSIGWWRGVETEGQLARSRGGLAHAHTHTHTNDRDGGSRWWSGEEGRRSLEPVRRRNGRTVVVGTRRKLGLVGARRNVPSLSHPRPPSAAWQAACSRVAFHSQFILSRVFTPLRSAVRQPSPFIPRFPRHAFLFSPTEPPPPWPLPLRLVLSIPLTGRPSLRIPVSRRSSSPSRAHQAVDLGSFHVSLLLSVCLCLPLGQPPATGGRLARAPRCQPCKNKHTAFPSSTLVHRPGQNVTPGGTGSRCNVASALSSAFPRHTRRQRSVTCWPTRRADHATRLPFLSSSWRFLTARGALLVFSTRRSGSFSRFSAELSIDSVRSRDNRVSDPFGFFVFVHSLRFYGIVRDTMSTCDVIVVKDRRRWSLVAGSGSWYVSLVWKKLATALALVTFEHCDS